MVTALRELAGRLRAFFRARDLDRDLEQELDSHVRMLTEENVRRGMAPDEARRAARIRVGGIASIREQHRDVRGFPAFDNSLQDLRFAFRLMARERWFSAAAVVALALGIGVNAIGFTIVNAAFFRGLPFEDSDRLYMLSWQTREGHRSTVSHADFRTGAPAAARFAGLAGFSSAPDEHQRRPRFPGAGARSPDHGERVRRARAATAPRP